MKAVYEAAYFQASKNRILVLRLEESLKIDDGKRVWPWRVLTDEEIRALVFLGEL